MGHHGNSFISFAVAAVTLFASLYESFQALTSLQVSHFVEWFSGDAIDSIWTNTTQSGSGMSLAMADEIDGGLLATAIAAGNNFAQLNFNDKRHYDKEGSIFLSVAKRSGGTGVALIDLGMFGDNLNGNGKQAVMRDLQNTSFKTLLTGAAASTTQTNSDVATDTNYHSYKIEMKASSVELSIDGVLKVTNTTNLPNLDLQPGFKCFSQSASADVLVNCRYIECFNTSISILSSLYERLSALTQIMGQRVVETFSGSVLNERWQFNQIGGSGGSALMEDEIDGGVRVKSGTGANNNSSITFNDKRQYDFASFIQIAVWKLRDNSSLKAGSVGLSASSAVANDNATWKNLANQTFKQAVTINTSTTTTNSTVATDANFHVHKIEAVSGSSYEFSIDGVLEVTQTTNLPDVAMQPIVNANDSTAQPAEVNITYLETYNRLGTEAEFPSVYEMFNELTTVARQHWWDWFDGNNIRNWWTLTNKVGSGTANIEDTVDGGMVLSTSNAASAETDLDFNAIRPFDNDNSILITIGKRVTASGRLIIGLVNNRSLSAPGAFYQDSGASTFKNLTTRDASAQSTTDTDVNTDTNFTGVKIELTAADVKLFLEGVLKVTKTTNLPTAKLQPLINSRFIGTGTSVVNVRYIEAFNT